MNVKYSIVIPVYKSYGSLQELSRRIKGVFSEIDETYELIFVNDSPFFFQTDEVLKNLSQHDENIIYIRLSKNFGQQAATMCGIEYSKGEYVITMDDDLQHSPEDIPLLIGELEEYDIVIAKLMNKKHSLFKRFCSWVKGYFDFVILGKPKHIQLSSFRLFSRKIALGFSRINTPYPFIPALLFAVSHDVVNVEVQHKKRSEGVSNYTLTKLISMFSNLLVNNSALLLKIVGSLGIFSFGVATVACLVILLRALYFDIAVAGWASIMLGILFFGGLNLLSVGIIGEYLIRIMTTSENRPNYFIDRVYK